MLTKKMENLHKYFLNKKHGVHFSLDWPQCQLDYLHIYVEMFIHLGSIKLIYVFNHCMDKMLSRIVMNWRKKISTSVEIMELQGKVWPPNTMMVW